MNLTFEPPANVSAFKPPLPPELPSELSIASESLRLPADPVASDWTGTIRLELH